MPIPNGYTDASFAAFVRDEVLTKTATALGWIDAAAAPYPAITTETLLAYGVTDIALATDIPRLRALGRREGWRAAMQATANRTQVSIPGGPAISAHQFHDHALKQYQLAADEAAKFRSETDGVSAGSFAAPVRVVW